jgi:hypothetical protein
MRNVMERVAAEPQPRILGWRAEDEGRLLVHNERYQWLVALDDDEAMTRLRAMIRVELCGPCIGCC